ncbi:MAG: methyl-accepting chemotaxis protein [Asticcacaulis sp.]|uniref:methyl-accepting chemotaxis protein n=1 Tax=Asticcacaulis sp. TaxID=1872648 RepID=UPI003F7C70BC
MFIRQNGDLSAVVAALNASQAVIEFTPEGRVLTANDNFLRAMGYRREEVVGRHHEMFCDDAFRQSEDYARFWKDLATGKFQSGAFKRVGSGGRIVWLQATYNPVFDRSGRVTKVIKFASDITEVKVQAMDAAGKMAAIDRAQGVIEFTTDGVVLTANDNFLQILGYSLTEIKGQHHQTFCDPAYVASEDYKRFWEKLAAGEFIAAEFRRLGKGGREVFIQASYNPIFDDTGAVTKVVKFATDVTETVKRRIRNEGISREIDGQLGDVLVQMDGANQMASGASSASTETSSMVNAVAAAAEELSASVREIAESMSAARGSVEGVFKNAEVANSSAGRLAESADAMNNVVSFIQGIASQINLLALNATIESARAGEAGKGFAVVASEVKTLANQASASTKTIGEEIAKIQAVSTEVADALSLISGSMTHVLDSVSNVASAIEEQHAVTGEISANMQAAVSAVHEIEESLTRITGAFSSVASSSESVKANVERLVA